MPSLLDFQQIIQSVYDADTNALNVNTGATITFSGALEVAINATDDSIAIGDGSNTLSINPDGTIDVVVSNGSGINAVNIQDGGNIITVDGTVTANAGSGTFTTKDLTTSSASVASVSSSASNVTVLASNSNRRMATFFNNSTQACYLKFGATASTSSFTIKMAAASYYELPHPVYTGIIDGIWDSANGAMLVTEIT